MAPWPRYPGHKNRLVTLPKINERNASKGYSSIQTDVGNIQADSEEQTLSIKGSGGTTVSAVEGNPDEITITTAIPVADHGGLTGLSDDDHSQYLTEARHTALTGDHVTNGDSHDHSGGDGAQIDHTGLSNLNSTDYTHLTAANHTDLTDGGATTLHKHDHGGMDGLTDDDHGQYALVDGTRAFTGKVTINGSANVNQLVVKGSATQSNANQLLVLKNSAGTILTSIHSDHEYNTFIGPAAGNANNSAGGGLFNFFCGNGAGQFNTTGQANYMLGYSAGSSNKTGSNNICIGIQSGQGIFNTSYGNNVFLGTSAGYYIKDGGSNVGIGSNALRSVGLGDENVAIGSQAGFGPNNADKNPQKNTAIGAGALYYQEDAAENVAIGYYTGRSIKNGSYNTLIGPRTGANLVTGSYNILIGNNIQPTVSGVNYELKIGHLLEGNTDTLSVRNITGATGAIIASGIYNLTTPINLGRKSAVTNHALIGDDALVGGKLEVNETAYFDDQIQNFVASGQAPFTVTSPTVVTNLNADKLDGRDASYFAVAGSAGISDHGELTGLTDNDHTQYFNNCATPIVASGQQVTLNIALDQFVLTEGQLGINEDFIEGFVGDTEGSERLLAETTISAATGTKQTLYTCPAGYTARITTLMMKTSSLEIASINAASFGWTSGAEDWATNQDLTNGASFATKYKIISPDAGFMTVGTAGQTFGIKSGDTDSGTITFKVFGVLDPT